MSFLEVKHLRKSFPSPGGGESLIVDLKQFSLKSKALCAMKGESGSGKTTFLHLLAGILQARRRIHCSGRGGSFRTERGRRGTGCEPNRLAMFFNHSTCSKVSLALRTYCLRRLLRGR